MRSSKILRDVTPNPRPGVLTGVDLWRVTWPPQSIDHLRDQVIARYTSLVSRCTVLLEYYFKALLLKVFDPRYNLLESTFTVTVPIDTSASTIATLVIHSTRYILPLPCASAEVKVALTKHVERATGLLLQLVIADLGVVIQLLHLDLCLCLLLLSLRVINVTRTFESISKAAIELKAALSAVAVVFDAVVKPLTRLTSRSDHASHDLSRLDRLIRPRI